MLFPDLFDSFERSRWNLHEDIPWDNFNPNNISDKQFHGIKMNAILEWSAMPTAEMFLRDNIDDADFSAFISIWFFEEQKHSLTLLEYLRRFAPKYLPTEEELAAVRFNFDAAPALESLALHFCGEIRLNNWYKCAESYHSEPVLKIIYATLANDEARHARAYYNYMQRAMEKNKKEAELAFCRIGHLMTNKAMRRVMHPTNLHVNQSLYPNDTVNSKLPDPKWLSNWLDNEINFDDNWESNVESGILNNISSLLGKDFSDSRSLRKYYKELNAKQ